MTIASADGFREPNPALPTVVVLATGGTIAGAGSLGKATNYRPGQLDVGALVDMARDAGVENVYVHVIFDGRSTEPGSAPRLLREFGGMLEEKGAGLIVSGVGRGVALDRDQNWAKVKRAYDSLVYGTGERYGE